MKVLDEKLAADLRIFLIDVLGDKLELHKTTTKAISRYEWQYQKPLIYRLWLEEKQKEVYCQRNCLNTIFVCKDTQIDKLRNVFFQVNSGKIDFNFFPFGHYVEGRKKTDIVSYNAFMLDFDLKFGDNQHYQGEKLTAEKNKLYERLQKKLPLEPDYVVESRNGFHVYYLIPKNDRNMSSEYWHTVEYGIFYYVKKNVSACVDEVVKKSNQLMRLPYSLHRKDGNENDFVVYIRHERNRKIKSDLIAEGDYTSAQFSYSLEKILNSFNITKKNLPSKLRKESLKEKQKNIDEKNLLTARNKYPAIDALLNFDIKFFKYLQRKSPKQSMTRVEAVEYIQSVDMRIVLNIPNQPLNAAFSSLFYTDVHPSDYFFTNPKTETTSYYCRAENKWYNNIFNIVYRLLEMNTKNLSAKELWRCTFNLVYSIFGLNVTTNWEIEFEKIIENNLKQFGKIVTHSKETKYLKCATDLYTELMKDWKEHVYKNNIDFRTAHRTIAADWIGRKIKKNRSTVQKMLLLLEYVGLIKKIDSNYKRDGKMVNEYRFTIITEKNIGEIISKAKIIKSIMDKPLKQASRKVLEWAFEKN